MLRKTVLVLLSAALMAAPSAVLAQEAASHGPKMDVPTKVKDFGVVPQGQQIHATFQIVNDGDQPLEIRAVRPTCGCTVAKFDRKIAPGRAGLIKATVDTTEFAGPITKSLLVLTNDPQVPTTTLVIKAIVQPYLQVLPRPLIQFNVLQGEQATHEVTVVSDRDEDFKVTKVESSVPFITASVRKLGPNELIAGKYKTQYRVTLKVGKDAPIGPVNANVVIHTTHPHAKTVRVKVYGVVRSLLYVTPAQIQFGTVSAKVKPGRNVIVVSNRSKPVKVTKVSVGDAGFVASVTPIEEGRRYEVSVTITPKAALGLHATTLVIRTTDPAHPELKVPVRANIKK
jgi:hypothetical protein